MGKSALGFSMAEYNAVDENKSVAVFSLEMSKESLIKRAISSRSSIPLGKILSGDLTDNQWSTLSNVSGQISRSKLFIDDRSAISPSQLRAKARKIQRKHGLDLIMIDYLQLMVCKAESRVNEIEEVCRQIKSIAKDLNVPVIALSQLNRDLEKRTNKRPQLSDLKGSGSIEQDSDVVISIYRDEVYDEDSPDKGVAEVIIGKQRNGITGTTKLSFEGKYVRFCDRV